MYKEISEVVAAVEVLSGSKTISWTECSPELRQELVGPKGAALRQKIVAEKGIIFSFKGDGFSAFKRGVSSKAIQAGAESKASKPVEPKKAREVKALGEPHAYIMPKEGEKLEAVLAAATPINVFIYGPTGSGKTTLVRAVAERLGDLMAKYE